MGVALPVEIIGRVIQLILDSQPKRNVAILLPLLLVSPTFRYEAERLIYAQITLRNLPQVVKCFTAICKRPHLGRAVRSLTVSLSLNSTAPPIDFWQIFGFDGNAIGTTAGQTSTGRGARHVGRVLKPFGALVERTLAKLTHLQEYSLTLGGPVGRDEDHFAPVWLPSKAPFKLQRFVVDLNLSRFMANFLLSQRNITDLLAPHFQPSRVSNMNLLRPSALPRLRGIVARSGVAAVLAPGRPLRRVCLKDGAHNDVTLQQAVAALPQLAKATVPVRFYDISVPDATAVQEALLEPLGTHLPSLEVLTVRRTFVGDEDVYGLYVSDAFSQPLAAFANLKHIVLPAPSRYTHLPEIPGIGFFHPGMNGPIAITANINAQIINGPPPPVGVQDQVAAAPPPPGAEAAVPTDAPPPPPQLFPQFLQQIFAAIGVPPGAVQGPQAAPGPMPQQQQPNPGAPGAPFGGPMVFTQSFVIQGDATFPVPPLPAQPNAQDPIPAQVPVPAPALAGGIPAPAAVPFGPALPPGFGQAQAQPAAAGNGGGLPLGVPADLAAQLTQATNNFLIMLGQTPPAVPGTTAPAATAAAAAAAAAADAPVIDELEEDDEDVPPLMPVGEGNDDGEEAPPEAGPGGFNWTTTFMGMMDPAGGVTMGPQHAPGHRIPVNPKDEELLDKGQRSLRDTELKILNKWKLGGFAPNLRSVSFDMDLKRRTTWTWKPAQITAVEDEHTADESMEAVATGDWEVEYVVR